MALGLLLVISPHAPIEEMDRETGHRLYHQSFDCFGPYGTQ
jgi:hypothetical protein